MHKKYSTIHILIREDDETFSESIEIYRDDVYTGDSTWKSRFKSAMKRLEIEVLKGTKKTKRYDY